MGDLVGTAVEGTLYYVPKATFERVKGLSVSKTERAAIFADLCRVNALYMIARAGSGHIGSSFSSLDLLSWLHLEELRLPKGPEAAEWPARTAGPRDIFFSSKGHDAPALYSVLIGLGRLDFDLVHRLRQLPGLPGHPDVGTPHIVTNTGSLGMGIAKAKGMVLANRLAGREGRVFVLTGDGELQEGQNWESLVGAKNHAMHELTIIVDHNKLQSDTFVAQTSDLGDLVAKFTAFGCAVKRIDGHDLGAFAAALAELSAVKDRPHLILADTVKGRGVSFMEHTSLESDVAFYRFHSGAPEASAYTRAAQELIDRLNERFDALSLPRPEMETVERPAAPAAPKPEKLIAAYAPALKAVMDDHAEAVVLDCDLLVDTGQLPTKEAHPKRFVECGIAEMDMVSMAGGLALSGNLPICHSFACFLATRPNEHIYNNATERTKVVYVASLAGVLPGGPGHSHQSVRDISALGGVPGLVMCEPSCEAEVPLLLRWCTEATQESAYLRLVSVPYVVPFALPAGYAPALGKGVVLREGKDVALVGYGIVMLSEAFKAAEALAKQGVEASVVNLPWLNRVDGAWLAETVRGKKHLFALDNHYVRGGQGDFVAAALAEKGWPAGLGFTKIGVEEIPVSGGNADVLRHHGLDAASIAARVAKTLGK
jgi:transketolase